MRSGRATLASLSPTANRRPVRPQAEELHNAIREYGLNISPAAVSVIMRRYSHQDGADGLPGLWWQVRSSSSRHTGVHVLFDDFVALSVRLRALSNRFRAFDVHGQGYATLKYDDFIQMVMSC